jgi:hypothetical protein
MYRQIQIFLNLRTPPLYCIALNHWNLQRCQFFYAQIIILSEMTCVWT